MISKLRVGVLLLIGGIAYAGSYEDGLSAKQAGRHDEAIAHFARALEQDAKHVEAWFQYGTVLGWEQRYDEAEKAIATGLELAPNDYDLRLAMARLKAWQGQYADASKRLNVLAQEHPNSNEVKVMQGRVAGWQEDRAAARKYYEDVIANDPNDVDAISGLAELAYVRGDTDLAKELYLKADAISPSPIYKERIEQIDGMGEWRLDVGFTYSTFRKSSRSDWLGSWFQVTQFEGKNTWWLMCNHEERFSEPDTTVTTGFSRRFGDRNAYGLFGGVTPDADWAAEWILGGELVVAPFDVGYPVFVTDLRHSDYVPRGVWMLRTGVDQPLGESSQLSLRWNRVDADGSESVDGYSVSLERNLSDDWWVRGGFASGAETLSGNALNGPRTLRSKNMFVGVRGPLLENLDWRLDVGRELVDQSADRNFVALGFQYQF